MQADVATAVNEPAQVPLASEATAAPPLRLDFLDKRKPRCPVARPDEIVVCAQEQEQYRLRPLDSRFEKSPETPEGVVIAKGVEVGVEQGNVGGWPSNRIMIRAKIKF